MRQHMLVSLAGAAVGRVAAASPIEPPTNVPSGARAGAPGRRTVVHRKPGSLGGDGRR